MLSYPGDVIVTQRFHGVFVMGVISTKRSANCQLCRRRFLNAILHRSRLPSRESWYQNKKGIAFLALLQQLIVIIGVPVGLYTYWDNKQKERKEAQLATYEKLDDRYWSYEGLALRHVGLDVSDAGVSDEVLGKLLVPRNKLSSEQRIQERQLQFMLIAMYERAFIMYSDKTDDFRKEQWVGWDNGLRRWCKRESFREAWAHLGVDFDGLYQEYVNKLLTSPDCSVTNTNG
jgi:hypothetical protein